MKKILLASALVLAVSAGQSHALTITYGGQVPTDGSGLTSAVGVYADNTPKPGYAIETFDDSTNLTGYNANVKLAGGGFQQVYVPAGAGFNSLNPATDIIIHQGSFSIQKYSTTGVAAAPANDSTFFAFAPEPGGTLPVNIEIDYTKYLEDFGVRISYLGLYYGSIDTYNNLQFYSGNSPIQGTGFLSDGILTGAEILQLSPGTPEGSWTAPGANVYVNLFFDANDPVFTSFRFTTTGVAFEADNMVAGFTPVPEPATMLLFGAGLAGLAGIRRKRNK